MSDRKAQKDMILEWLERNGTITPMEVLNYIGCYRLGARIWDLRRDGHNIVTERCIVPTKHGGRALVAVYRLESA